MNAVIKTTLPTTPTHRTARAVRPTSAPVIVLPEIGTRADLLAATLTSPRKLRAAQQAEADQQVAKATHLFSIAQRDANPETALRTAANHLAEAARLQTLDLAGYIARRQSRKAVRA